jgi:hypothetical protein
LINVPAPVRPLVAMLDNPECDAVLLLLATQVPPGGCWPGCVPSTARS